MGNVLKLPKQLLFVKYISQARVNDFNFFFCVLIENNIGIKYVHVSICHITLVQP